VFRQIFLFSISLFFLSGCVSTKNFYKEKDTSFFPISTVLENGYNTALYKAKIDVENNHISGLIYFKIVSESSYRIIFMSEFGLNLLDYEYKNNSFELISCKDFLNKKIILNAIKNDIKLLIDLPKNNDKKSIYKNPKSQISLVKIKEKLNRYYYFFNQEKEAIRIIQTKGLKHIEITFDEYDNEIPKKIEIYHKRIKLGINLNLIKLK
jgi:hypothetical protein